MTSAARTLSPNRRCHDTSSCRAAPQTGAAFKVTAPVCCDLELVRATSDEFFAERPTLFDGTVVDLAFIDGLHVAEFAFRDFVNVERRCAATSVIVLDDMLPRSSAEAARVQCRGAWAGDVFKVAELLRQHRGSTLLTPGRSPAQRCGVHFGRCARTVGAASLALSAKRLQRRSAPSSSADDGSLAMLAHSRSARASRLGVGSASTASP